MNILVLGIRLRAGGADGSALIYEKLIEFLAARGHNIWIVSLEKEKGSYYREQSSPGVTAINHCLPELKRSTWHYFRNVLEFRQGFKVKRQNPEAFADIVAMLKELVTRNRIELCYGHLIEAWEFLEPLGIPAAVNIIDSQALAIKRKHALRRAGSPQASLADRYWFLRIRCYERTVAREAQALITVGAADSRYLRESLEPHAAIRVMFIPNGVDTDRHAPLDLKEVGDRLIFTGNMSFPPNVDAVVWFAHKVLPRVRESVPGAVLRIAGANPVSTVQHLDALQGVEVVGFVEDLRQEIGRAAVVVCPMRMGSGIKNKTLEAMAMGKAIVSTALGAESIDAVSGTHYLKADSEAGFADSAVRLLKDKDLCRRMGINARKLMVDRYRWDLRLAEYETLFLRLVKTHMP